jgi:hypothetical protein
LASGAIARDLPKDVKNLRVFARPGVTFYLSQASRISIERQPGVRDLFAPGDPAAWALVDMALIRQSPDLTYQLEQFSAAWVQVHAFSTTMSLPVLLDIEPSAATATGVNPQTDLRLFRPRRAGDSK